MHILQTLSTPKLVTPHVYSFTKLAVGMECRKRPLFIIITMAAMVTDRLLRFCKRGIIKGHTCGEDRTGDPMLTNTVFHAVHVILSLKLGDHKGLALFLHGCLLKRTLPVVLPVILIQIPIRAFPSPVPAYCRGQSAAGWCCPAAAGGMPAPGTQLWETQGWFGICSLFLLLLVLLLKLF